MRTLRKSRYQSGEGIGDAINAIANVGSNIRDTVSNAASNVSNAATNASNVIADTRRRTVRVIRSHMPDPTGYLKDTFTYERYPGEMHARERLTGRPYNFVGKLIA